jgi:hypothetical protein
MPAVLPPDFTELLQAWVEAIPPPDEAHSTPLVYKELHRVAIAERSFAGFHGTSDNADGCRPIFRFHHPQQAERPPQM